MAVNHATINYRRIITQRLNT